MKHRVWKMEKPESEGMSAGPLCDIRANQKFPSPHWRKIFFILFLLVGISSAVTRTWNGGGGSDNWTTAANWVGSVAPSAGDDLVFGGSTRLTPNNDFTAATTFNSISFSGGSGAFVIGGNSFQLSGGATAISSSVSSGVVTISNAITITTSGATISTTSGGLLVISGAISMGSFALTVSSNGNTDLSGVLSGTGSLTKTGNGNLVLYGTNSYTGSTTVSSGKLILNNASALGSTSGGTTISTGAAIDLHGQVYSLAENITLNGLGPGNIGALVNDNAAPATYAGNITLASAASIKGGTGSIDLTGSVSASNYNLTLGGGAGGTASGVLGMGSGSLFKQDPGTWTLSGANTYTGTTSIADGVLSVNTIKSVSGGSSSLGAPTTAGNGTIALGSGTGTGTLEYTGTVQSTDRVIDLAGTTGGGALRQSGSSGNLTFSSAMTATGVGAKSLILEGSGAGGAVFSGAIVNGSGTTSITKGGTGTWTLSGANTYTGGTTLNAGTLNVNSTTALGGSASTLTIASGTTLDNTSAGSITLTANNSQIWTGNFTYTGTQALNMGTGAVSLGSGARQVTVSASTLTLGGAISGTGGVTKAGAGTLTLNGINTYSGATTVNAGTLLAGSSQAFGSNSAVTLINAAGAILDITGFSTSIGSLTGGGASGGNISLGAATLTIGGDNTSPGPYSGIISGTGGVTKTGTGTLTLSGSNTYTGSTTVSAGTLAAGSTQGFGINSAIVMANAASTSLNITGFSNSIGSLTGGGGSGGNVILGAATLTIGGDGTSPGAYAGVISGTGGITKTGSGTLTLTAANTYTGATTISSGNLTITATSYATPSFAISSGSVLEFNLASIADYGTTTFTGAGTLRKSGAAEIKWSSGAATFQLSSGALIDVVAGTFTGGSFANDVWTSNLSDLTVASGAIFASAEANAMVDVIAGAGTVKSGYTGSGYLQFTYGVDNGTGTFSGVLADDAATGNFTKAGTGTQTLSGVNTYSGVTTIQNGTLSVNTIKSVSGGASALGSPITAGNGTIALGSTTTTGTLVYTGAVQSTDRVLNLAGTTGGGTVDQSGSGLLTFSSALTATGVGAKTLTLQGSTASNGTLSAAIVNGSGTTALTKTGTGTWTLSGTNTYTGATTVSQGTLEAGSTQAFGVNSAVTLANVAGTSLDITGYANSIGSLTGGGATGGDITLGAATLTIGGDNSSPGAYAGVISGTGYVTKSGTGTLTLSGANTYTGSTSVTAGSLKLGSTSALGTNASGTYISTGANLDLNGQNYTTTESLNLNGTGVTTEGALVNSSATPATFGGQISLAGATSIVGQIGTITLSNTSTISGAAFGLTLGGSSGGTFAGVLGSGTGDLTKVGTGTWTLSSANSLNSLTLTAGNLNLGTSLTHTVSTSLSLTGGTLDFGSSTLEVQATTVDLHLLSVLTPGTGTLKFTGSSAQTFTPKAGSTHPNLTQYGTGGTTVVTNGFITDVLTLNQGTFNLGAALSHTANTVSDGGGGPYGSLNFNTSQLHALGNVTFGNLTTLTAGSGSLYFDGSSGAQFFTPKSGGISHPNILHGGGTEVKLFTNNLVCLSFNQSAGTLNFNGFDVSTSGNFTVTNGTTTSFLNLAGRTLAVTGTASFAGTSSANKVNLNPGATWYMNATGPLTASLASLAYSNATGSASPGSCSSCIDGLNNQNWSMGVTWDGGGSGNNWSTAGNWSSDAVPTADQEVKFDATSTKAVVLDANETVKSIVMVSGYTGDLDFGSSILSVPGVVDFRSGGTLTASSGTLALTGSATQNFHPLSGATFPSISKSGAGAVVLVSNNLSTANLNISAGTFDISTNGLTLTASGNLQVSGGFLDAGSGSLGIAGNVTFSSGTVTNPSGSFSIGGSYTHSGATVNMNSGTVVFNGTATGKSIDAAGSFNNLTINGTGGAWTAISHLTVNGTFAMTAGTLDLSTNVRTLTVNTFNQTGGTISSATGDMDVNGNFTMTAGTLTCPGSARVFYAGGNFAQTGGSLTPGSGTITFDATATGKTVNILSTVNNLTFAGSGGGWTLVTNGITGSALTLNSGALNLGASLIHNFSASPSFTGGSIDFGSSTLRLAGGNVNFNALSGLTVGTGTLEFTGSSAQAFTPKSAYALPQILQSGTGTTTLATYDLLSGNLYVTAGEFNLGTRTATVGGVLNLSAGTLTAINGTLDVNGNVSVTSGTLSAPSGTFSVTGSLTIASGSTLVHNNGTILLDGTATGKNLDIFPTLYNLTVNGTGGAWTVVNNPLQVASVLSLADGGLDMGSLTHSIGSVTSSGGVATLDFGTSTVNVTVGNAVFSGLATLTAGASSTLGFTAASGIQSVEALAATTHPHITHTGAGTLRLMNASMLCRSFTQSAGTLNFNNYNFTTNNSGNFTLNNGTSTSISGLVGRIVTVAGNATLSGASSSDRLDLNPGSPWYLRTTGTASVSLASVDYSDASGYSTVTCSNCANGGSTTNWTFGVTWSGGGGDANWTTATNWASNSVPTSLDAVIFNSTATAATLDAAASAKSISFTSGYTGTFSFSSNTLTINSGNADFQSGGAITAGTGALAFTGSSAQTFIPKSGATFPALIINNSSGVTLATNNLVSGDLTLTSGSLTLGTGMTHAVKNISPSAAGGIIFGNSTLQASGSSVSFANLGTLSYGTGTLELNGTSAQTFTGKNGVTQPNIKQNGSGGTTLLTNNWNTGTLTIASGILKLGTSLTLVANNFSATGGGLDFGSSTLEIDGATVNFTSLSSITPGTGTLFFGGGSAQTFTPKASTTHPNIKQYGSGGTTLATNGLTAGSLTLNQGTFNLGTGLSHSFTSVSDGGGGPYGNLDFNSSQLHVTGNVALGNVPTLSVGSGTLDFNGTGATQLFTPKSSSANHPAITHTGSATVQLTTNPLSCLSFSQSAGQWDFNGLNLTTTSSGNFTVTNGTTSSFAGLAGRTLTVAGVTSLTGTSTGNLLNLNPGATWTLSSSGTLTATLATLNYSNASGSGAAGTCVNCSDGGNNTNWSTAVTWDGGGTDNNWSTVGNWGLDAVPTSSDNIIFDATSVKNLTLDVAGYVNSIKFTSGYTGTFNFSSNTLAITSGNADFSSGGTITAGTGALAFTGTSAQTFVPKSGATFPAIIQNGVGGTTLLTNALTAGDVTLTSGTLNLGAGFTHSVAGVSGAGGLNFATSNLNASGNVNLSSATTTTSSSNTLTFTGTTAQTYTPKASVTALNLTQNGTGGTTVSANDFTTPTLTISAGTLNLGTSRTHTVSSALTITGGGLDFSSSILKVAATTVNLSGLVSLSNSTGTLEFSGASAQTFTPKASTAHPSLNQNGAGGTTIVTNNLTADVLTITSGTFALGTGLTHQVSALASTAGELSFGTSALQVSGDANLAGLTTLTPGTGTLAMNKSSGTQILTPKVTVAHPAITHNSAGTLQLATNALNCASFSQNAGVLDFNSRNITTTGNFTVTNGTSTTFTGLSGRTLTVGGAASFTGTSSANRINLNPGAAWTLTVTGSITGSFVSVDFSDASSSTSPGTCTNCANMGSNTNWIFSVDWDGGAGDGLWTSANNWTSDYVPASTDIVSFNATSSAVTLDAAASVKSITFTSGYTGVFSFSNNTLTINFGNADFRSGGTITAGTGALAFTGTAAQTFIPKSGATFPALIQNGTGGTTILTNALTAGDVTLTSGTLNLGSGFTHTVAGITGTGGLNFATSNLNASGNVNFSSTTITASSSNTLAFTGATAQTYTPKASVTALNLTQNGTGGTTVSTADFTTPTLTLATGTLNLGTSRTHTVSTALTITGGGLDFSSSTLKVGAATVNLNALTALAFTTGILEFSGTSAQTFTPKASTSLPALLQSGVGGTTVATNPINSATLTLANGIFSLGTSLTHTIANVSSTGGGLDFSSSTLNVTSGNADLSGLATLTAASGKLVFNAASGSQTLTPKAGATLPSIEHNAAGMLILTANDLICSSFRNQAGKLDLNGRNITVASTGYFDIFNGNATTFANLTGRTISVNGNATLLGQAGSHLNLNPASVWTLHVTGTLNAVHADIQNSLSTGTMGQADSSINLLGNTNWNFLDSIKPDNVTGLLATKISGHDIQLVWTASTSSDADSIMLRYRTNGSYPSSQTDGTFFRTVKANKSSDTANGMADKAIYHFSAFVKDSSGNWSLPSSAANDSAWLPDVTAPAGVTAFSATAIGPTTAALAWVPSVSSDPDTTIIRYRLDGVYPTSPTDGTLWKKLAATANKDTVTGLTTNTVYHFGAFVRDTSGNYTVASTATQDSSLYQTPITGTITISDIGGRTKNPVPGLAFTSSGADSLRFSLLADTAITTAWKSLRTTDSLNIAVGADGPRIALVQFKNTFGKRSLWTRDTTILDRVAPVMTLSLNAIHSYKNWPGYIIGKALDATTGTDSIFVVRLRETDNAYYNGSGWTSIPDTARLRSDSAFSVPMPASALDSGFYHFSAYAKDKTGNVATLLDKRVLYEANRNPMLAASTIPDTALQNQSLRMTVDIGDLDLDDSVHTVTAAIPAWLTKVETADSASAGFSAHRIFTLTGTPAQAEVGPQTLNIQAQDLGGKIFNYSKTFLVKDVNDPPVFAAGQSTLSVQEDSLTTWAPLYADPDPKDLHTFTLLSAPNWIQVQDSILTFHPGNRDVGNYTIQLTVSDGSLLDTLSVALTVLNVNDGPLAFPSANWQSPFNWKEDILDTFTVVVVDMDKGDVITLLTQLPPYLSYVAGTDSAGSYNHFFKFSALPRPADTGAVSINLLFSDQAGATTKLPLQGKVLFVNDSPLAIIKAKQNLAGAAKFTFDVSDEDGSLAATRFHYRLVGPTGDTLRSGISGSSILSLQPLADGDYQIAVLAEDQGGLKQKGYTLSPFTINGASSLFLDSAHWNMVAIPNSNLPATSLGSGAAVTTWDESGEDGQVLGRYASGASADSLKRGKGYWVRVNKPITLKVSQKDLLDQPFTLKLSHAKQGWNQIGNPFPYFIDLSATKLQFWEWDAARRDLVNTKGILKPWGAYWVQVFKDTILTLKNEPYFLVPASSALTKASSFKPSYQRTSNWSLQLALQAGPFQDRLNFMGIRTGDNSVSTSADASDGSALNADAPKFGEYIALHFHKPGTLEDSLSQGLAADFREHLDSEEEWWDFTVENSGTGLQNASLDISGLNQVLSTGLYAFLVHRGESVPVTSEDPVVMAMEGPATQYALVITPHADFAQRLKGNFNISQNFPNPVLGQTSFRFFLPQTWDSKGRRLANLARLRINVYDYSGRLSAQVVDGAFKPGSHTLLWNPIGKNGGALAKGAYLYRLETPGFNKTLKMVIK